MIPASSAALRGRRIFIASGTGVLLRVTQILASLITLPVLLHQLGLAGFGIWSAATSLAFLSAMLDLGLGSALVTLIPQALRSTSPELARAFVSAALWGGCGLSLVTLCAGGLVMLAGVSPGVPFIIAGLAVALNIPLGIGNEIWMGLQKAHVASSWQIFANILNNALLLAGAFLGWGPVSLTLIVFSVMLGTNAAILAHALTAHPPLRPHWRVSREAFRRVGLQGGQMFLITIAALCAFGFDTILTLDWLGAGAAAQMSIALRVCTTATGIVGIATQPLWPGFADAITARDRVWLKNTLFLGTATTAGIAAIGGAFVIVAGAPALRWWLRTNINLPASLFWIMAAWIFFACLPHVPGLALHAASRLKPQIFILSAGSLLGLILKYLLGKQFGVAGIMVVYPMVGLVFTVPFYFWITLRWFTKLDTE